MKQVLTIFSFALILYSCAPSGDNQGNQNSANESQSMIDEAEEASPDGVGKFKNVELPAALDATLADAGQKVYDVKCAACHKLNEEKLVGPGWKNVTTRRRPAWIMNFATNTEEMLDKDPAAQAQLEICLVRMPNQSLTDDDARHVLEFMRRNDGVK
jgi:mono/diheme cytochrome c family protein